MFFKRSTNTNQTWKETMRKVRILFASVLTVTFAATAACGSESDSAAVDPSPYVEVQKLDTGVFPTSPGTVGPPSKPRARLFEAQRLASVVPLPMEVDSRFIYQFGDISGDVHSFISPGHTGMQTDDYDADANGFIAGFSTSATTEKDTGIAKRLSFDVMLFSNPVTAARALKPLYDSALVGHTGHAHPEFNFKPVPIDRHPETRAWLVPTVNRLESYTSSGRFIFHVSAIDTLKNKIEEPHTAELIKLSTKSITVLSSKMKDFRPTPLGKILDIPVDHDSILGRTLPRRQDGDLDEAPGFYDQHGALHFSANPKHDSELFDDVGMDWMGNNGTKLYHTKSPGSAEILFQDRAYRQELYRKVESPKDLPTVRCIEYHGDGFSKYRYSCMFRYDEYFSQVSSNQLIDVHQRASAQYAILENSK